MSISFYQTSIPEIKFIHIQNQIFSYPMHTHRSSYTIVMVQKGEVNLNNSRYFAQQFFIINPYEAHQLTSKKPSSLFTCSIESTFFTKYEPNEQTTILNRFLHHPRLEKYFSYSFKTQVEKFLEQKKYRQEILQLFPRK